MASPNTPEDDDVFARFKASTDKDREDAVRDRVRAQYERAQRTLAGLIDENSTLPVSISEIRIEGAKNTRNGFLASVIRPALSSESGKSYTLATALEELHGRTNTLHRFGIFHPTISIYLDKKPTSTPDHTDLSVLLTVAEKSRLLLKTGTDVGNAEGTGYVHLTYRNVFGGAESLNGSASIGTRTRSAYDLNFTTPVLANPGIIAEVGGYASTRSHHHYANHEEALKGARAAIKWGEHEVGYGGVWRQVTGLGKGASQIVRSDAGDSVKSALSYSFLRDRRDNALLPGRGYLFKAATELAGVGPLGGDVAFGKVELESQGAVTEPRTGISFTAGLRSGLLYPLPSAVGEESRPARPSRINDRFQLGGPTDVRGFRECGLGPKAGEDSVGGDAYIAGGASVLFPLPKLGREKPLRLQAFVNGGRLVGLQGIGREAGGDVNKSVAQAAKSLTSELPSIAAGFGLVYAHPVARFELNFCLPIVKRPEDRARKGIQFGVGMNFL
ncbi:uncharacterized protein LAJ45_03228 [Morchella importuna]|uniref:Bacterial surface antigen (D15) domain-containing protein n=1 Tax=Morchella conica CCBAS932 TaxID=1392247 RepID=A0A3N4KTJ2_9PEZI|nr:uncharacterized protein LAJ45_03228 [Morchella importuna]KAH8152388.1 hypothetical protein LAJ45_03228 [Morchella importuna]RPB13830.1 hypothetical protein P167DRAFT_534806 [Morchella conica CCBAS932]